MKRLFKLLLVAIILLPIALAGVILLSLEDESLVASDLALDAADIERAKDLARQHDPRSFSEGEVRSVSLTGAELNLLGNYLAHTLGGAAEVSVGDASMDIRATLELPASPLGQYLNLRVGLRQSTALPRFATVKVGSVRIPGWLADFALDQSLDLLYEQPGYSFAEDVVREVSLSPNRLDVTYAWTSEITDAVRLGVIPKADQQRIKTFQEKLSRVVVRGGFNGKVSLEKLVKPLFALAGDRALDGDPVADNRAAILVLAAYVNARDVAKLAPDVGDLASIPRVEATVQGRDDLAQHFLTSAALAVHGGSPLSKAIGLYKEVDDSRGGSGFSFTDLQADNAGTRFGERAIRSVESARSLQSQAGQSLTESALVPSVAGLPEGLTESKFKDTYGEVGSPAYNRVLAEIDKRLASSPLYR